MGRADLSKFVTIIQEHMLTLGLDVRTIQIQAYPPITDGTIEQYQQDWMHPVQLEIFRTAETMVPSLPAMVQRAPASQRLIIIQSPSPTVVQRLIASNQTTRSRLMSECYAVSASSELYRISDVSRIAGPFKVFFPQPLIAFSNLEEYKTALSAAGHPEQPLLLKTQQQGWDATQFPSNLFGQFALEPPIAQVSWVGGSPYYVRASQSCHQMQSTTYPFANQIFAALGELFKLANRQIFADVPSAADLTVAEQGLKVQFCMRRDKARNALANRLRGAVDAMRRKNEQFQQNIQVIVNFREAGPINIIQNNKQYLLIPYLHTNLDRRLADILRGKEQIVFASFGLHRFLVNQNDFERLGTKFFVEKMRSTINKHIYALIKDDCEVSQVDSKYNCDISPDSHQTTKIVLYTIKQSQFDEVVQEFGLNIGQLSHQFLTITTLVSKSADLNNIITNFIEIGEVLPK